MRAPSDCVYGLITTSTRVTDAIPLLAGETPVQTRVTWKTLPRRVLENRGIANMQENEYRLGFSSPLLQHEANKPFRTARVNGETTKFGLGPRLF